MINNSERIYKIHLTLTHTNKSSNGLPLPCCMAPPHCCNQRFLYFISWLIDENVWEPCHRNTCFCAVLLLLGQFHVPNFTRIRCIRYANLHSNWLGCRKHMTSHKGVLAYLRYCYWFLERTQDFGSSLFHIFLIKTEKKMCDVFIIVSTAFQGISLTEETSVLTRHWILLLHLTPLVTVRIFTS